MSKTKIDPIDNNDLENMTTKELQLLFHKLFGHETKSKDKKYLIKKIGTHLLENDVVDDCESTQNEETNVEKVDEAGVTIQESSLETPNFESIAQDCSSVESAQTICPETGDIDVERPVDEQNSPVDESQSLSMRDPRIPPVGTVLSRKYKGVVYEAKVLEHGFEYAGRHFNTLSGVARAITHLWWSGFSFFRLN